LSRSTPPRVRARVRVGVRGRVRVRVRVQVDAFDLLHVGGDEGLDRGLRAL